MNVFELQEALFPGGKRNLNLQEKVAELVAVHGRPMILGLLEELREMYAHDEVAEGKHAGAISEIQPLTREMRMVSMDQLLDDIAEAQGEPPPSP